ncbi:hypothetical protein GPECTOR_6g646 [Gonium pectorale]|uniref:Uncharacterized protein n=1 Tax=Gonium pectorale TaxID=33097 RepID=A0A150GV58_GONPE|nr:hypothetical protein GPECTOR_6g646 [Gonium pectorale]|eukprot:KXZ53729.1 hypothetical protein GPECTOR_6g646 [Gonium pectorale]
MDTTMLGWRVFAGVRRPEDGSSLVAEAPSVEPLLLDVSSDASVGAAAAEVAGRLGGRPLAGLVNNAGKGVFMPLEVMPVEVFQDVMDVNVTGVLRLTQAAMPLLKRASQHPDQPAGRIVNVGSYAGSIAIPLTAAYSCSKFALEALSDVMRYELGPKWGIKTVLIKAGGVKTPIWQASRARSDEVLREVEPARMLPYSGIMREILGLSRRAEEGGITAEEVAATIEEALTSPNPRSRYLIGNGAEFEMTVRRLLPDWVWDRLLLGNLRSTGDPWA